MSVNDKIKAVKQKDKSQYKEQVLAFKKRKAMKHKKSKLRHPVRTVERGHKKLRKREDHYWKRGEQMARAEMSQKPQYYYGDKTAVKGIAKSMSSTERTVAVVILSVIAGFIIYGFVIEHF